MEVTGSNTIISRLLAQNIRHTGLSNIYSELLSHSDKNNLFCREYKEAFGKKIYELKTCLSQSHYNRGCPGD